MAKGIVDGGYDYYKEAFVVEWLLQYLENKRNIYEFDYDYYEHCRIAANEDAAATAAVEVQNQESNIEDK